MSQRDPELVAAPPVLALLALVGVAEGLCGLGDGVLVGGLEGGQAPQEVDLAVGGLDRG